MSLTGTWKNSYGSTMQLTEGEQGYLIGLYTSSTGSSGTYWVVGHAGTSGPTTEMGQPLALSILWRSIAGGKPDISWHWSSGFSGQVTVDGSGVNSMILMHAMVDSDDTTGVGGLGTYIDKLLYTKVEEVETGPGADRALSQGEVLASDPLQGSWAGQGLSLDVEQIYASTGYLEGSVTLGGQAYPAVGFTDTDAVQAGIDLQSVTISVFNGGDGTVLSLAGTLNLKSNVLTVLELTSHGTAPGNDYAQTTVAETELTRVA